MKFKMILSQFDLLDIVVFDSELSSSDHLYISDSEWCESIIKDCYEVSELFKELEITMPSKNESDKIFEIVGEVIFGSDISVHDYEGEDDYWVKFSNVKWQLAPKWLEKIYLADEEN